MPDIAIDPGSAAERIALFLQRNPDEALARTDIATKLSIAPGAVEAALQPAVMAGLVTIANSGDVGRVWRAGPRLKLWQPQTTDKPAAWPASARGGKRRLLPLLKVAELEVAADVPVPPTRIGLRGTTRYDQVFDLLTADGMSVAKIDVAYMPALMKALQVYLAGRATLKAQTTWVVRRIEGTNTCGVWRLAKQQPAAVVPARKVARAA